MRLFVAVVPPEPVLRELDGVSRRLRALPGADRLRWTNQDAWHFTLAFYGEVAEALLPDLSQRLTRAAGRHRPFPLRLVGGGRFGGRTLWADVAGDREALTRLAESAAAAGRRAGVPTQEERAFRPHLTLARSRRREADLRLYVDGLAGFTGSEWVAAELALVRSHLPASGVPGEHPRYEVLATWSLGE